MRQKKVDSSSIISPNTSSDDQVYSIMNSDHIKRALSIPFFEGHFMGFLFSDLLHLTKKKHKTLDFYIVNTNHVFGQHWYGCIRAASGWIIFDCSTFTPAKDHDRLKKALSQESRVILDCKQLQDPTSLSCGLHVISFIYFMYKRLRDRNIYIPNFYCNKLLGFCKSRGYSPDNLVFYFVRESEIFPLEVENEREIRLWLAHFK